MATLATPGLSPGEEVVYTLSMTDKTKENHVKVRAVSPGRYPILVLEMASGGLRIAYYETGYDLERTKPAGEDWLRDNAIGRHSFIVVDPPEELPEDAIEGYVRREVLGEE